MGNEEAITPSPIAKSASREMVVIKTMVSYKPKKAFKILHHIIPHLVINNQPLSGNRFLAGAKSIADLKSISPCGTYPSDRTSNANAVVDARQKKINANCHSKAKSMGARRLLCAMILKRSSATARV